MDVVHLLRGSRVERVHLLTNRGTDQAGIVVVERRRHTAVLVDFLGFGSKDRRLLAELGSDGLVLANGALADILVDRVEKGQETRRNALFVYCQCQVAARLTVKVYGALDDIVTQYVAVRKVLCNDGRLDIS